MMYVWVLLCFPSVLCSLSVQVFPLTFPRTPSGKSALVTLSLVNKKEKTRNSVTVLPNNGNITVNIHPDYTSIVSLNQTKLTFTVQDIEKARAGSWVNKTVSVSAWLFGYYYLDITANDEALPQYELVFTRGQAIIDTIVTGVLAVGISVITINMGCELDLDIIKAVLRKPIGPLVGFCSQFAFMPLVSYGSGLLLFSNWLHRLGLFVLGCSPGGTMSNFWAVMLNGDINLSITMTFISTLAAMGMMPVWLLTLGQYIPPTDAPTQINIPYSNLIIGLVLFTVPLLVGMVIRWKRPAWADYLKAKVMKPLTLVMLVFMISFGLYNMRHVFFFMTWQMLVAGMIVVFGGYLFGGLAAYVLRLGVPQIISVALETSMQNASICFVLLKVSLPEPESDIAAIPAVTQLIVTGPPLWIMLGARTGYKKYLERKIDKSKSAVTLTEQVGQSPVQEEETSTRTTEGNSQVEQTQM